MNLLFKFFLAGIALGILYCVSFIGFSVALAPEVPVADGPSFEKVADWYDDKYPDATPWETCEQEVE